MSTNDAVANSIVEERRKGIAKYFVPENIMADSFRTELSPSGKYRLDVQIYNTEPNRLSVSRGVVYRTSDSVLIADIKRNYVAFWHAWVKHPNGSEYLLCGEDYQGYTVVNLTQATVHSYLPISALKGQGFCWAQVYPSPDGLTLAVDGCYWACPFELVFYDFSCPEELPLPELQRLPDLQRFEDGVVGITGWENDDTFALTCGYVIRKADGAKYSTLSDEEQHELDQNFRSLASNEVQLIQTQPRV